MKKLVTLLAALAMFVACAEEKKPASGPEAPPTAEKPAVGGPSRAESGPEAPPTVEKTAVGGPSRAESGRDAPPTVEATPPVETPEPEEAAPAPVTPTPSRTEADNKNRNEQAKRVAERIESRSLVGVLGAKGEAGEGAALITGGATLDGLAGPGLGSASGGLGAGRIAGPKKKGDRARRSRGLVGEQRVAANDPQEARAAGDLGTEEYAKIDENPFKQAADNPLSTFSIDVDTASYSNVRRFLREGRLPPKDAVRIEELVNYFTYEYQGPTGDTPFSVTTELATCPWAPKHHILMVGLQGRKIDTSDMPKTNLVFLMDVSGSMNRGEKLPLLKKAFRLLVDNLRPEDRVAIVVYAGAAGVVLPSTPGTHKPQILEAIERLRAGGSTAGGAGIKLAYQIAKDNFIEGGNNRVILATDGDFNVGASSTGALTRMIEEKRKDGIFLTVLGFGRGNYKGSRMESLADKGNGNYAYIDSVQEAKKVLVTEMGGTLLAIAKDVKIQVEFNPAKVSSYRLIGYENRLLAKEDFADDTKDAGELGAGHTVTALYEIVPAAAVGSRASGPNPPPAEMKYSETRVKDSARTSPELCTVKLRWKQPDGDKSTLETFPVLDHVRKIAEASGDLRWASSVALFGMALRGSDLAAGAGYPLALEMAEGAVGWDPGGYRSEFLELARAAKGLAAGK